MHIKYLNMYLYSYRQIKYIYFFCPPSTCYLHKRLEKALAQIELLNYITRKTALMVHHLWCQDESHLSALRKLKVNIDKHITKPKQHKTSPFWEKWEKNRF